MTDCFDTVNGERVRPTEVADQVEDMPKMTASEVASQMRKIW